MILDDDNFRDTYLRRKIPEFRSIDMKISSEKFNDAA